MDEELKELCESIDMALFHNMNEGWESPDFDWETATFSWKGRNYILEEKK